MFQGSDIIAIRAPSFNIIPKIPIVETADTTVALFRGLKMLHNRKKVGLAESFIFLFLWKNPFFFLEFIFGYSLFDMKNMIECGGHF